MIPFAYMPPPQPAQQIVVQTSAPTAQSLPAKRAGGMPPEFPNRRARRAYQADVIRRFRHTMFSKLAKQAMPNLVSVRNVRAELKGLI